MALYNRIIGIIVNTEYVTQNSNSGRKRANVCSHENLRHLFNITVGLIAVCSFVLHCVVNVLQMKLKLF